MLRKSWKVIIITGTVLLVAALSLLVYNRMDERKARQSVSEINDSLSAASEERVEVNPSGNIQEDITLSLSSDEPEDEGEPSAETEDTDGDWEEDRAGHDDGIMPAVNIDGYDYIGTLSIPRFDLELPIMSEWSYPGLKLAPGRYTGSVWTDDIIICGHNYESHFGNLKNLEAGDFVYFTDTEGNKFSYVVKEVLVIQPTAIDDMIAGDWDLTLFTCTSGGKARVTVRCLREE